MSAVEHYGTEPVEGVDFDRPAQKGWAFFTKFLLWNIIGCASILILIGLFTVWS